MPDQTFNIGAGQTYSTIAAWEAAADVSGGFWKGVIVDAANFNEHVTIASPTGTPTASNYVWLTVDGGVRHAGVVGTGHARVVPTTSGHAFQVSTSFTRIDGLEIQPGTSNSDECVRVNTGANDVLLENLVLKGTGAHSGDDRDGVYTGDWPVANLTLVNVIAYDFDRAGLHLQKFAGAHAQTVTVAHCTFHDCGSTGETESGGINARCVGGGSITLAIHNLAATVTRNGLPPINPNGSGSGTNTLNGSHYATDDAASPGPNGLGLNEWEFINATNKLTATDGVTAVAESSGSWIVYQSLTGTLDLRAQNVGGNIAVAAGKDPSGISLDSRADATVDIAGQTRPATPTLGAYEADPVAGGTPAAVAAPSSVSRAVAFIPQVDAGTTVAVSVDASAAAARSAGVAPTVQAGTATPATVTGTFAASRTVGVAPQVTAGAAAAVTVNTRFAASRTAAGHHGTSVGTTLPSSGPAVVRTLGFAPTVTVGSAGTPAAVAGRFAGSRVVAFAPTVTVGTKIPAALTAKYAPSRTVGIAPEVVAGSTVAAVIAARFAGARSGGFPAAVLTSAPPTSDGSDLLDLSDAAYATPDRFVSMGAAANRAHRLDDPTHATANRAWRLNSAAQAAPDRFVSMGAAPQRFLQIVLVRKGDPMPETLSRTPVEIGVYTTGDVPFPLVCQLHQTLGDESVVPIPLFGQTPARTVTMHLKQPTGGTTIIRACEVLDPSTLRSRYSEQPVAVIDDGEEGWVEVQWADGDLDFESSDADDYSMDLVVSDTAAGGTLDFSMPVELKPNVKDGASTPALVAN